MLVETLKSLSIRPQLFHKNNLVKMYDSRNLRLTRIDVRKPRHDQFLQPADRPLPAIQLRHVRFLLPLLSTPVVGLIKVAARHNEDTGDGFAVTRDVFKLPELLLNEHVLSRQLLDKFLPEDRYEVCSA